jgi:hypothetical protein
MLKMLRVSKKLFCPSMAMAQRETATASSKSKSLSGDNLKNLDRLKANEMRKLVLNIFD